MEKACCIALCTSLAIDYHLMELSCSARSKMSPQLLLRPSLYKSLYESMCVCVWI